MHDRVTREGERAKPPGVILQSRSCRGEREDVCVSESKLRGETEVRAGLLRMRGEQGVTET